MGKDYQAKTPFQASLVGTDKPINLTSQGNELGIKNPVVAPLVGGLVTALDINPLSGSGKKVVGEVSQETASYLAKLKKAKELAKNGPEVPGVLSKVKDAVGWGKRKVVDFTAPIEDTLSAALQKNKISMLPEGDVANNISKVFRAPSLARQFMKDGGFDEVVKAVDNADDFDQYLIAKQAIDVDTRGIKTGRDLAKDSMLVRELAPKYEDLSQKVYAYSRTLLDKSVADGLISSDLSTRLKQMYPNYVPLNRVFSAIEESANFGSKGVASNSTQSIVRKLVGSDREIESPVTSIYQKTLDVFAQGEKNLAAKTLASYERLPGNPFQLKEIKAFKDTVTGRGVKMVGDDAPHTITFLDNGTKRTFSTTKEIAEAAKALNVQQLSALQRVLSLPVRIARLGLTSLNPAFVAANLARDQVTAYINTQHALSVFNPLNFTRAIWAAIGHGDLYDEAIRAGALGTSFDIARSAAPDTIDAIRSTRSISKFALHQITHPKELLRSIEDLFGRTEELTRLQIFSGTKKALLAKGLDEASAATQAARAAREGTVDFARRGEYGNVLNSIWLYMNANIQGVRTLVRTMQERPAETLAKIAVAGVLPVITTTLYNLTDPERKKIYQDIPEYEKDNNLIFISPGAEFNEETGRYDGVWKIPMSQEIRNVLQLPRRIVEQMHDLDPVRAGEVAQSLLGQLSPIGSTKGELASFAVPQAIKPSIQAWANKDFFTGAPIVPQRLQGLPEEMQVKPDTSGLAKQVGGALDVSPIKVEKFAKDTFGSLTDIVFGKNVGQKIGQRFLSASGGAEENKQFKELNEIVTEQKGDRMKLKIRAEETLEELRAIAKEKGEDAAQQTFAEIVNEDPNLAEAVAESAQEDALGLTSVDKMIKQLGVDNGERAKYIWKQVNKLGSKEEKNAYIKDLIDKKIISNTVADQLNQLKDGR